MTEAKPTETAERRHDAYTAHFDGCANCPSTTDGHCARALELLWSYEAAQRVATMRKVHNGWDGRSQAMVILKDDCGCTWTRDGRARLSTCTPCLRKACRELAAEMANGAGA